MPSSSCARSQSERSWSSSRTSSPSRKRAARRASCSSISASRPCASGSSGISSASARPRRIASACERPVTAVALVEDEVDDRQHGGEAVREQVLGWDAERNAGRLDLALGAHEPLRHRRLGDEERARDLVGRQTSERPQRQRDLRVERERRVAAREDQLEPLVGNGRVVHRVLHGLGDVEQPVFAASVRSRRIRSIARFRAVVEQPCAGVRGRTGARPALGGDRERLLRGLLGEVEVAEEADQRGDDAAPLVAEDLLEDLSAPRSGAPRRRRRAVRRGCARRARSRRRGWPPRRGRSRRAPPSSRRTGRRSSASGRRRRGPSSRRVTGSSSAPPKTPGVSEIAKYSP